MRLWAAVSVIFLGGLLPAVAATLEEAAELLRKGEYDRVASMAAEEIPAADALESPEWRVLEIEALLARGRIREAVTSARVGLENSGFSLTLLWAAREALLAGGETGEALTLADEIEGLMARRVRRYRDAASIVTYGRALLANGWDARQVLDQVFSAAQKLFPEAREPYLARGELALRKSDYALAARAFREGLAVSPVDPDFLFGLAQAYAASDREQAQAALVAALEQNPRHVPALLLTAEMRIDAEDYAGAGAVLDEVGKINPHRPEMWALRAVLAHLRFDAEAETAARSEALRFNPANPLPDHLIGRKLSQKYRFAEGAAAQRRALEIDPSHVAARAQLASDLLRLGEEDEGWALAGQVHGEDGYDVTAYNLVTLRDTMNAKFRTLRNGDFIVRMDAREADIYGERVLELLAEARRKLGAKYGIEVARPTIVEIFSDQRDFGVRTFGMPENPGYLGVCFGRVVTANSPAAHKGADINWESVLWHEFCHTVTLQATRNRMPRWLSEGISVYEERQENPAWGEQMTPRYREMILSGELTPVSKLSGAFLTPKSAEHLQFAYFEASLVIEFLIDRYGLDALRGVLKDLHDGVGINDSLARRVAPMETLESSFEEYAKTCANGMAPGLNWDRPDPGLLVPGAEDELAEWAKDRPDNYWVLMRKATELIEDGKSDEAEALLHRLIDLYPRQTGSDSAPALLATIRRGKGDTAGERQILSALADRDPDARDVYARLMELAAEAGDWADVVRQARRYLAVNPLVPAPWRSLAEAAEHTGDLATAARALRTVLVLDSGNPAGTHFRLARVLHRNGDLEAKRHLLTALEDAPRHREALRLLLEMQNPANDPPATGP